jgi:16S rRNA (uracil1498-N3)-methyltransferase
VLSTQNNRLNKITIAIGPEGGWSPEEVTAARASGWLEVALGPYILRTETAALVAISRIMHCFEE